ncbi:TPA: hypothetical protein PXM11_004247 [Yersinia enterocolitica]|uniref:hypothetical protein n=1 Tax=Yersinia enterocolitica TaxID=630 RepID=UPI000327E6F9|nr:hypothetical protein [Yersinia enterocolitica]AOF20167.1 hypothetical protein BED34_17710 [Yersinia enterocolitica]AOF24702.1 hypothetical protein BED33_20405 [Yersinia enterocolitica]AOF28343.1 hypothetical protein BED32_17315 [Yersinia enterocolitica]AOF32518.1 hypothetical protein BED35_18175 [Yersinia enterocolitica]AOF36439.1 hypothetical protein BFS78_17265 [Yersinia enterocolitica]
MITQQQLDDLEADINDVLQEDSAKLKFSLHFAADRLNDTRNVPPITLEELRVIFDVFIKSYLQAILKENDGFSFTIQCEKSFISIPCIIEHDFDIGKKWVIQQVLTIMRNPKFTAYHNDMIFKV